MRELFCYGVSIALMTLLASGCCVVNGDKDRKSSGVVVAIGEIRQANISDHEVWVEKLLLNDQDHHAGVLMPGRFAHMGFARLVIGGEIKLVYIAFPNGEELPPQTRYFDGSQLKEVAAQVRYMKFTYVGGDKWILQVYDRSETADGYAVDNFLKNLVSQENPVMTNASGNPGL